MLPASFQQAIPIIEKIENMGYQAYYVGGCVRDFLLNKEVGDIDIATSAPPEVIQHSFSKVILVGVEHGTVIVRYNDESYEVTTFRLDGDYSDKRRPDTVQFVDRLDEDLKRRDFTINALAMDKTGNIIDLFNGKQDLKDKIIRTVGNGEERFSEDPLRIIRAIRFSSQLGFTISDKTIKDIIKIGKDIEGLAAERITNEISKVFMGTYVNQGIKYIKETDIGIHLPTFKQYPEIIHLLPNDIPSATSFAEVIALFHLLKPEVRIPVWAKDWKCSNETKKDAELLVTSYNYFIEHGLDRWLIYHFDQRYDLGFTNLVYMLNNKSIDPTEIQTIRSHLPIQHKKELAINGHDLLIWFPDRKQGPWLKQMLKSVEKNIVYGKLENKRDHIKEWLKWNLPETN